MAETQTWRVVLATGEVQEVVIRWDRDTWAATEAPWIRNGEPVWCVADFARAVLRSIPVEILAPGELTRAELRAQAFREGAEAMREAIVQDRHMVLSDYDEARIHTLPVPPCPEVSR